MSLTFVAHPSSRFQACAKCAERKNGEFASNDATNSLLFWAKYWCFDGVLSSCCPNVSSFFWFFDTYFMKTFQPTATLNAGITGIRAAYGAAAAAAASVPQNPNLANYAVAAG